MQMADEDPLPKILELGRVDRTLDGADHCRHASGGAEEVIARRDVLASGSTKQPE